MFIVIQVKLLKLYTFLLVKTLHIAMKNTCDYIHDKLRLILGQNYQPILQQIYLRYQKVVILSSAPDNMYLTPVLSSNSSILSKIDIFVILN